MHDINTFNSASSCDICFVCGIDWDWYVGQLSFDIFDLSWSIIGSSVTKSRNNDCFWQLVCRLKNKIASLFCEWREYFILYYIIIHFIFFWRARSLSVDLAPLILRTFGVFWFMTSLCHQNSVSKRISLGFRDICAWFRKTIPFIIPLKSKN